MTIAVPPGYIVEQGPMTNIYVRNAARRSHIAFIVLNSTEARKTFDDAYYRQRQKQSACRASLSGYPAEVVGGYDRGQFALMALWDASWGGDDAGKSLLATIASPRAEEATELRAVLHTVRPVEPNR